MKLLVKIIKANFEPKLSSELAYDAYFGLRALVDFTVNLEKNPDFTSRKHGVVSVGTWMYATSKPRVKSI